MIYANAVSEYFINLWESIKNFFTNNVWNIVKFFSILVIGIIIIWSIIFVLKKAFNKKGTDKLASRFVITIIRYLLWLILILVLLMNIGVEITGITAALSAAVLAIGMALKDNMANIANGLILIGSSKYKTGDYVIVGSVEGSITEINLLFTALKTPDGKQVLMPNSTMVNSQVTNLGAYPSRRVSLTFSVAYDSDVELVKKVVTDVMKSDGRIYLDPAPFCRLKTLEASSINFFCHCWCDNSDYWDVYYYLMETIFNEFKKNGINIPYQQIEIRERTDKVVMPYIENDVQERVEKKRTPKKTKISLSDIENGDFKKIKKELDNNKAKKTKTEKKEK